LSPAPHAGRREQTEALINFIIAHDVLLWAGVILAIIGLLFVLTRTAYESLNAADILMGLLCGMALIGAYLGRNPRQVLGATDAGTLAITAELLALLIALILARYRLSQAE
jgi:drug/metabolite transporter (DMT)-like permease